MQKASAPSADAPTSSTTSATAATPAVGSLSSGDNSSMPETSIQQQTEAQPPDKSLSPAPDQSTSAQTSAQPSPTPPEQPTPIPTPTPTQPQQPPYPHQPYGYHHLQAAYPHAPYYQHPPGYPYPSPYPYPQMPATYPPPQPHPVYPQQPAIPFAVAPLTHPPQPQQDNFANSNMSNEDLPSYEEMIVEALIDSGDPEGCAPKDLFTWMASRYPLQSNFRPSASQALQKAFKRGRFQKSSGGKYRLNATWEGGNTSRRTTRRPQTQNPPASSATPASPFTHAPLVHHHQSASQTTQTFQGQNYSLPFRQTQGGFQTYQQQAQAKAAAAATTTTTTTTAASTSTTDDTTPPPATDGAAHDAWEAAQNILKAINFDSLLQIPQEDEKAADDNASASLTAGPSTAATSAPAIGGTDVLTHTTTEETNPSTDAYAAGRAELQAQLALLAAQLAELSQEDEEDHVVHYPVVTSAPAQLASVPVLGPPVSAAPPIMASLQPPPQIPPQMAFLHAPADPVAAINHLPPPPVPLVPVMAVPEEEEDSEDDDDMEEVI
ncbi:hypothetical protein H0H81_000627 [Sphagnurus paluster]|uniref:Histone H1 n=1 Tax=Sphagnurus paluster TaxID=117069 RepID=A0A9P7FW75_9AGAR|nr:hypothetical protein H0H81_000627 [Sphagnurus paluster]